MLKKRHRRRILDYRVLRVEEGKYIGQILWEGWLFTKWRTVASRHEQRRHIPKNCLILRLEGPINDIYRGTGTEEFVVFNFSKTAYSATQSRCVAKIKTLQAATEAVDPKPEVVWQASEQLLLGVPIDDDPLVKDINEAVRSRKTQKKSDQSGGDS